MIRTLIFGAIAGYVGKKLYDEGKLTEFKDDIVSRYGQAKADLDAKRQEMSPASSLSAAGGTSSGTPGVSGNNFPAA